MDFMSMKNPLTPTGIEPATFRFVAQHLIYVYIYSHTTIKIFDKSLFYKSQYEGQLRSKQLNK